MTNLNDREAYNRENYPSSDNRNLSGQVTGTNETNVSQGAVPRQAAYRDGYINGRDIEQRRYEVDQEVRDNDNAARGLLLGILLTGAVGLATAAYFLSQRNDPNPAPASQTIVVPKASPSPQQSPQVRERVIERDRVVPVPQQAPAAAPDVNITVPRPAPQAPASQSAPTQPAPTQSSPQSSTPDQTTQQAAPAQTSPSTTDGASGSTSEGTATDGATTQPNAAPGSGTGQ